MITTYTQPNGEVVEVVTEGCKIFLRPLGSKSAMWVTVSMLSAQGMVWLSEAVSHAEPKFKTLSFEKRRAALKIGFEKTQKEGAKFWAQILKSLASSDVPYPMTVALHVRRLLISHMFALARDGGGDGGDGDGSFNAGGVSAPRRVSWTGNSCQRIT